MHVHIIGKKEIIIVFGIIWIIITCVEVGHEWLICPLIQNIHTCPLPNSVHIFGRHFGVTLHSLS